MNFHFWILFLSLFHLNKGSEKSEKSEGDKPQERDNDNHPLKCSVETTQVTQFTPLPPGGGPHPKTCKEYIINDEFIPAETIPWRNAIFLAGYDKDSLPMYICRVGVNGTQFVGRGHWTSKINYKCWVPYHNVEVAFVDNVQFLREPQGGVRFIWIDPIHATGNGEGMLIDTGDEDDKVAFARTAYQIRLTGPDGKDLPDCFRDQRQRELLIPGYVHSNTLVFKFTYAHKVHTSAEIQFLGCYDDAKKKNKPKNTFNLKQDSNLTYPS